MKKLLFFTVIVSLLLAWVSQSRAAPSQEWFHEYNLSLSQVAIAGSGASVSGATTAPGGSSPFYVTGGKFPRYTSAVSKQTISGIARMQSGLALFQLTGATVSQVQVQANNKAGGYSGSSTFTSGGTFYIYAKGRISDDIDWGNCERWPIFGMVSPAAGSGGYALGGSGATNVGPGVRMESANTPFIHAFYLPPGKDIRIYWETGATPFDNVTAKLVLNVPEWIGYMPQPILLKYDTSAFGTAGTTVFGSSAATPVITRAEGAYCIEVQPVGDDVFFSQYVGSQSGNSPFDTSQSYQTMIENKTVWQLTAQEFDHFWWGPDGDAIGTLNVKQWNRCP